MIIRRDARKHSFAGIPLLRRRAPRLTEGAARRIAEALRDLPLALFTAHPAQLPDSLATVAGDPLAFTVLTRLLRQHWLARVKPTTLTLHRLLAAILRAQPHRHHELPIRAVRLLRPAVPADDPWDNSLVWSAWRQLLPHVLAATDPYRTLAGVEEDVAWLLHRAASYLQTEENPLPPGHCSNALETCAAPRWARTTPDTLRLAHSIAATSREVGQ